MTLTPIHIRGKKRKTRGDADGRGPISPKSHTAYDLSSSTGNSARKLAASNRAHPSRPRDRLLSALERLPSEIIEQIFLDNCNIALPRSSPVLARKLSSGHVYNVVLAGVFSHFQCETSDYLDTTRKYYTHIWHRDTAFDDRWNEADLDSDISLQAELSIVRNEALKWRWVTWAVFRDFSKYIVKKEKQRLFEELKPKPSRAYDWLSNPFYSLGLWFGPHCYIPSKLLHWSDYGTPYNFLQYLSLKGLEVDQVSSYDDEHLEELWSSSARKKDFRLLALLWDKLMPRNIPSQEAKHIETALRATQHDLSMAVFLTIMYCYYKGLRRLIRLEDELPSELLFALIAPEEHMEMHDVFFAAARKNDYTERYAQDEEWAKTVEIMFRFLWAEGTEDVEITYT